MEVMSGREVVTRRAGAVAGGLLGVVDPEGKVPRLGPRLDDPSLAMGRRCRYVWAGGESRARLVCGRTEVDGGGDGGSELEPNPSFDDLLRL